MEHFHVYVERPVDRSPDAIRELAHAIAQRYGLPTADLVGRLEKGRFRVKANVDRVTAEAYVRALAEVGAQASIESASSASPSQPRSPSTQDRAGNLSLPPQNQRSGSASLPPTTHARAGSSSLPPQHARASPQTFQSGLSAAYTKERAQSEGEFSALGANSFSLESLDGNDEGMAMEAGFAPPPDPERPPPVAVRPPKPSGPSEPLDLFLPPDAEEAEQEIGLHAEVVAERAHKTSLPPATAPVETPVLGSQHGVPNTPAHRRNANGSSIPPTTVVGSGPAGMPPARFAAGVFLSILLGFLPAHVIAASREKSAFISIDAQIVATQSSVDNQDSYDALDGFRTNQLAKKHSERRSIAFMAFAIWAVVGAGLAFVYFKKLPWDKLTSSSPP